MIPTVRRDRAMADATSRGSPPTRVTSDASMATSAPVPMATPRSAWASAGASLMPSPIIATARPPACSSAILAALSPGSTSARTRSVGIPTWRATASAVARWSPVTSHDSIPAAVNARTASAASGLTGSATTIEPGDPPVDGDDDRGPAAALGAGTFLLERREVDAAVDHQPAVPDEHRRARDRSLHTVTGQGEEPAHRQEPKLVPPGPGEDGRPDRVLAALLEGARQVEQMGRVDPLDCDHLGDRRTTDGQGPGLVEDDDPGPAGGLERRAAPDEDPGLGAPPGPDHDRGRGGQAHRARAGDDHDGDEGRHGEGEPRLRPEDEPEHERERTETEHDRDEDGAHLVGQALDRGLAALGALDHLDDPREGRVRADVGRPEDERAGRVEGRPDDLVAGPLRRPAGPPR